MITKTAFADRQFDLTAEFGKYVFAHPEVDDILPDGAHVFFEVAGEEEFNDYSRRLARECRKKNEAPVVMVQIGGLAPTQGFRLINPVIHPVGPAKTQRNGKKPAKKRPVRGVRMVKGSRDGP